VFPLTLVAFAAAITAAVLWTRRSWLESRWRGISSLAALLTVGSAAYLYGAWNYSLTQFFYLEDADFSLAWRESIEPALHRTNLFGTAFGTRFLLPAVLVLLLSLAMTIFARYRLRQNRRVLQAIQRSNY
jgi:hypothetical protein